LISACSLLGVPSERVHIVDRPELQVCQDESLAAFNFQQARALTRTFGFWGSDSAPLLQDGPDNMWPLELVQGELLRVVLKHQIETVRMCDCQLFNRSYQLEAAHIGPPFLLPRRW
jgi:hypothetical protein